VSDCTQWRELLEWARHAPSPHNVQPWKLKLIHDDEAELYIDSKRTLPKEDLSGSFLLLAMGLFIETLQILAANRKLRLSYEFIDNLENIVPQFDSVEQKYIPFARLKLQKHEEAQTLFSDQTILERRTSRIPYQTSTVPAETVLSLQQMARTWDHEFVDIPDQETIQQVITWDTEALFHDLNHPPYHDEIVSFFRFTDRESAEKRDGLDFRCMNFSRTEFWLSARMPWLMTTPILKSILKKRYLKQFQPIHHMGFIAGKFWDPKDGFEAGRFLAHFWLELTRQRLYLHPFGNLVTNPKASGKTAQLFGRKDIWLIFRYGKSATPVQSRRLHVSELLLD